ncbi:hypothetical protein EON62_05740 [archaeon]|nr:MAG: hypothetical protein EON62_05740 [archaeon]
MEALRIVYDALCGAAADGWVVLGASPGAVPISLPLTLAVAVAVFALGVWLMSSHGAKRSIGSGENNRWNRHIRTEQPEHEHKHFKLEHTWRYMGMSYRPSGGSGVCAWLPSLAALPPLLPPLPPPLLHPLWCHAHGSWHPQGCARAASSCPAKALCAHG